MSEQPLAPSTEGAFNADLRGVHYDFLKKRVPAWFLEGATQRQEELVSHEMQLPSWYLKATAQKKTELAASHSRYRETLNQVESALGNIQDVLAFAEQPLKDAIKARFDLDLDVKNVYFARKYGLKGRDDLGGVLVVEQSRNPQHVYRGISLLEAALANFEAGEAQKPACTDCEIITRWGAYNGSIIADFEAVNSQVVAIAPHEFAKLCRSLDLGKQYQDHLKAILAPDDLGARRALEAQLQEHHRQLLALSAEIASHEPEWGGISADAYRMIQQLIADPASATLDGKPVTFAALKVFDSVLVGPLLIGPQRATSDTAERLLVYIPHDPQQPLKEYADGGAFMADLRQRLHSLSYRRFFSRFVPQHEQGMFFQRFNARFKPSNGNGAAGDYPLVAKPASLPLDEWPIRTNLWETLRDVQVRKILADARAVAVPTEDEDRKARMERLASYLDAVMSVFNLGAFVLPGLGPIMLAVGAAQMCNEVFEGIEAYEEGDVKAMWAHFSSVALNVAVLATGARVAPDIKLVNTLDYLKPVTLPDGRDVLWNPDLEPYKVPINLPSGAQPDELGLYQHEGKTVLRHEGDHYQVRQEPETGQYRIQHPSRPGAYEPQLEHNVAGAWSHEVEEPLTWDTATLLRRLGLEQAGLDAQTLEQARIASGVEADVLRQTFIDNQRVPVLLDDSIQHFKAHQQLTTFVEQLRSSDPAVYGQADPAQQLQIMRRRGMLPADAAVRVMEPGGRIFWEDDARAMFSRPMRVVVIDRAEMARGKLLEQVLSALQGMDPALTQIPGTGEDSLATRAGKLREYIAATVDTFKGQLVEERYNRLRRNYDADVELVLANYPKLPPSMAAELLKNLTGEQLQAFRDTGLLPELTNDWAKWLEQEARVARAYEGLHLDTLANTDSLRLALHTLETLPGWPPATRLELRQYAADGALLDAIGAAHASEVRRLVLKDNGLFEAPSPRDFYTAVWDQLPAAQRQSLGFTDAAQLKAAITQAPLGREPLRTVLLEHPLRKPTVAPGLGLLGGAGGFRQMVTSAFRSPEARVRKLYPAMDEAEVSAFIQSLGEHVQAQLALRETELRTLKKDLQVWVAANTTATGRINRTPDIATHILGHWRRTLKGPLRLRLEGSVVELPALSADFSHVQKLELFGARWSASADAFLARFPKLQGLSIGTCRLTELPGAIAQLHELTALDLSANHLKLTPQSAEVLGSLGNLEVLRLGDNPLTLAPDFSGMPRLSSVSLNNAQLTQWPTGLEGHPALKLVDLSYNRITEVPPRYLNPAAEQVEPIARLNGVTLITGNRFPQAYWRQLDNYWRRLNQTHPDLVKNARADAFTNANPQLEKVRRMYPNKPIHEAREWVWSLGEGADAQLARLEREFNTLEQQLDAWSFSGGGERQRYVRMHQRQVNAVARNDRYKARDRILACWRRETPQMRAFDGQPIGLELDLSDLKLPSLPDLDADFGHVGSLKLSNMELSASPEGFLTRYPHLRWLDLSNNQLRALPQALGEMHGLTRLYLNNNQIVLTAETAQLLSQRVTLRLLGLHDNAIGIPPDFSLVTDIRSLNLRNTGIDTWPAGIAEQPNLTQIDVSHNRIATLAPSLIAPPDELLAQTARVTHVTNIAQNPLTDQTLQQVRAYGRRLEQAQLSSANNPDGLVSSALNIRAAVAPVAGAQEQFVRWAQGLSQEQVSARSAQWQALYNEEGARPFFDMLNRLEPAGAGHEDLQGRVWEVIDSISENTPESDAQRKEIFDLAGEPRCCDRAAYAFSRLEVRTLMYRARTLALDGSQGAQLSSLSKGLFRLHEVEKFAAADIQRSEAIVNDPSVSQDTKAPHIARLREELEIRLAYRYGLKDRLQLPGQPKTVRFTNLGGVSDEMLDAAYNAVIALDNSPQEFQALLSRDFWQDYVAQKYRSQFERQSKPYQQELASLHDKVVAGELSASVYERKAADLQARLAIKESELIMQLSREEVAQILVPQENLEALTEPVTGTAAQLQLSRAQAIEFDGKKYFVASMPDAGDGEHYLLWVQAADNPFALTSSGVVAKPGIAGAWKRRGLKGGGSDSEFEEASESMPIAPYSAAELSHMRQTIHFINLRNLRGSYNRANNGKYPLRDYQGRPIRIRKLERKVVLESGVQYTSEHVKPYIQFEGFESVGKLYEEKLQLRTFTADDIKTPGEQALVGQSMVVANRRLVKGEVVGVYGGTVLPAGLVGPEGQVYSMGVGFRKTLSAGKITKEPIFLSGDTIISRINTNFEFDPSGKPLRQASGGYNVDGVGFNIEADMMVGIGPQASVSRKDLVLTVVFAAEDIAAGTELRLNYNYTEGMVRTLFG